MDRSRARLNLLSGQLSGHSDAGMVHTLSPMDHLAPAALIPRVFYFATDADHETISNQLRDSLQQTFNDLPILSGTIGLQKNATQTGTLAIQAPFHDAKDSFWVKDLSDRYDFQQLQKEHFPTDAVDMADISPDRVKYYNRVIVAQANFIKGGLILTILWHHSASDETGALNIIRLWSVNCSGGVGADLVNSKWTDRSQLWQGRGSGQIENHPEYILRPEEQSTTLQQSAPPYIEEKSQGIDSAMLFFSDEALDRLKRDISKSIDEEKNRNSNKDDPSEASWISTHNAICALFWSRVTKVRQDSGVKFEESMFTMNLNGRGRMEPPLPPEYTGSAFFVSKAVLPTASLTGKKASMLSIANVLRKSVEKVDDKKIRDIIQLANSVSDIGRLGRGPYVSEQRNIGCSSWAKQPYYSLDWGKNLGYIKRWRWRKVRIDGIIFMLPRYASSDGVEGGIEIFFGLQSDQLKALREDEVFSKYAKWRSS